MSSTAKGKGGPPGFSRRYGAALRTQLAHTSRPSFASARSLGREALRAGLDTLDLVQIHEQSLRAQRSPRLTIHNSNGTIKRATLFFVAALTPIATAHRATLAHNGHLHRLNTTMRRHGTELAATRRLVTREIARRKVMQTALRTSERHYGALLDKSRLMQDHLRRLSHEILSTQEAERKRISRELHDQIGQSLTAVNVRLATLKTEATTNTMGLKRRITSTQRLVERSMNTVHRFARDLRPALLDDLGLVPALKSHMTAFTKRTGVPIRFTAFAAIERLDSDKRTVLYRVAQEALTNVAKHARASLVTVSFKRLRSTVRMEIQDNGKSFQVQRVLLAKKITRLGLLGMRERVEMVDGTFSVESVRGKGTTICAEIPFTTAPRSSS